MTRAQEPPPGASAPGAGLRALVTLIAQQLGEAGFGLQPAIAGWPGTGNPAADGPADWTGMAMSIETGQPRSTGGRHPVTPRRMTGGRVTPPVDEPEVAEEHTEIWRLVSLAQGGDGEAFGQLYDRYVDTVFRFIYFRVNDRTLAEDFTSETFLRALRRISTISYQGRDIGAWFVTIARNIVLDHVKSARARLEITTADTLEGKERAPSPELAVIEALTSDTLMAAVAQLGDEQRECVMLRFVQGLSVSETASVMGKNDGAIKALQHRAVRKLADLLSGVDL